MSKERAAQVGWLERCPIGGGANATVHATRVGRGGASAKLFWRCSCCTFVTPYGPGGQAFIEAHMVPMEAGPPGLEAAHQVPDGGQGGDDKTGQETGEETGAGESENQGKSGRRSLLGAALKVLSEEG